MMAATSRTWLPILTAAIAAASLGILGALVTDLSTWYYNLRKPAWQPPDWLFGPAWTLIFGLAALAGVLAWRNAWGRTDHARIIVLFSINAVLNVGWSVLFFRLHRPDWALLEVGFLWLSIAVLMVALWPMSRTASYLLGPYLAWVSFATVLNFAIVQLNRPFA